MHIPLGLVRPGYTQAGIVQPCDYSSGSRSPSQTACDIISSHQLPYTRHGKLLYRGQLFAARLQLRQSMRRKHRQIIGY